PGVLVLSEFAGAAHEMSDALLVNPHDVGSVATAIATGLEMSDEERRRRTQAMGPRLIRNDAYAWAHKFLGTLQQTAPSNTVEQADPLIALAHSFANTVRAGHRMALFLDYDGTLRGFTSNPGAAVPSEGLRTVLRN